MSRRVSYPLLSGLVRGFTLIETLVTVAIITAIVAITVPFVQGRVEEARVAADAENERNAVAQLLADYSMGVTIGTNSDTFKGSDRIYYDAELGSWQYDIAGIKPYGKCTAHIGHDRMILSAALDSATNKVALSWVNESGDGSVYEMCGVESNMVDAAFDPSSLGVGDASMEKDELDSGGILPGEDGSDDGSGDTDIRPNPGENSGDVLPEAVLELDAEFGDKCVKLSWSHADRADGYIIELSEAGGPFKAVDDVAEDGLTKHSYTLSYPLIKNGIEYSVRITPYNSNGKGVSSPVRNGIPYPMKPAVPANLRLNPEAGDRRVPLIWDPVSNATGYKVQISTDGVNFTDLADVEAADYAAVGLNNGTKYYFRVGAYIIDNGVTVSGDYSDIISATPMPPEPGEVTNLRLNPAAGNKCVPLAWDSVSGATGYRVFVSEDRVTFSEAGSTQVSDYVVTRLTNGVKYYFKVIAYFSDGTVEREGKPSAIIDAVPMPDAPGSVPWLINSAGKAENRKVSLSWGSVLGSSGYSLEYSYDGSRFMPLADVTGTMYTAQGMLPNTTAYVKNGTKYYFRVRAYVSDNGAVSYGGYSNVVSETPMPAKPANTTAYISYSSRYVKVTWDAVPNALGYHVSLSDGRMLYVKGTSLELGYSDGIRNGNTYGFKVRPHNELDVEIDSDSWSNYVSASPMPPKPADTTASISFSSRYIKISWTAVPNALGYHVYSEFNGCTYYVTGTVLELGYADGIRNGVTHNFKVKAHNQLDVEIDADNWSNIVTALPKPVRPVAPTLNVSYSSRYVYLWWNAVPNAVGYHVYSYEHGRSFYTEGTSMSFNYDDGIRDGRAFAFTILSHGFVDIEADASAYSNVVYAQPMPIRPPAPNNVRVTYAKNNGVKIAWDPVAGATGYRLLCDSGAGRMWDYPAYKTESDIVYVPNGVTYYFRVHTFVTTDITLWSVESANKPGATPVP